MTTDKYHTAVRLQLRALGYEIIPNKNKIPFLGGWNAAVYAAMPLHAIEKWPLRYEPAVTTGVRVRRFRVVDIDVDHELVDDIHAAIRQIAPAVWQSAPTRYGKSVFKCSLFCGLPEGDDGFTLMQSQRFFAGTKAEYDAAVDAKAAGGPSVPLHRVELFGGKDARLGKVARQVGIYGPHSPGVNYSWADDRPALHEIAPDKLPMLTLPMAEAIVLAVNRICLDAGWHDADEGTLTPYRKAVFDLTEATRFDVEGVGLVDLAGLEQAYAHNSALRVPPSFIPGGSDNRERGQVCKSPRYGIGVHVHGEAVTHYAAKSAPRHEKLAIDVAKLTKPPAGALGEDEPPPPADGDLHAKAQWLVDTHAYYALEDKVVPVYGTSLGKKYGWSAFQHLYAPWFELGYMGAKNTATERWANTPARRNIAGLRLHPGMPYPLYEEAGETFKNIYRRPQHAAGGDVGVFLEFMERFLPAAEQREFTLDWMAHKWRHPDIPGTSIIFVSESKDGPRQEVPGTGRGLLFSVAHQLYGPPYCRAQSFGMVAGTDNQAQFTDWMHGSLLVTVDESKTSATSYRKGEQSGIFEALKDKVDPDPKLHRFNSKFGIAFDAMSYCSFWIATNHGDAIALPEHERRFTVLENGRRMTPEEGVRFAAWRDDPANIGALARYLAERDLNHFNMREPLQTAAKAAMVEHNVDHIDHFFIDTAADMTLGPAFTQQQLMNRFEDHIGRGGQWQGSFSGRWKTHCTAIRDGDGRPRFVSLKASRARHRAFCFRTREAEAKALPSIALMHSVDRWGQEGETGLNLQKALNLVRTEKDNK